jgi:valyl-tRNA synthetase
MDKTYDPKAIEKKWYHSWEKQGLFAPSGEGKPYTIMIPPPNVTGTLHMGHAFQDTIMDILTRYHRMMGDNTLWQPGTDHAGIATQMVVERNLKAKGETQTRHEMGREKFVEKIWEWKEESGGQITQQLRRMGASLDWENERFTMDDGMSAAVQKIFIKLYNDGLIYRGKRLVNWDPVLKTAVSDIEVENIEEQGFMYHVRYPFVEGEVDGKTHMHIATTRPETILADGALAVHPDDSRYDAVIGKEVWVPMTDRKIPVIRDEYVDPEFGTGCVKITPAHDFNDYQVGQRHEMEIINLFTPDAIMNENAPQAYQGMDRFAARDKIVEDLKVAELLERIEPHTLKRPYGDRTGTVIEPYLTDQWFVKAEPLAKPAVEAVTSGKVRFIPSHHEKTYFEWMNNIQDWCISRQLWWGHRIPAWFDAEGNFYVGESEHAVREQNNLGDIELTQDEDVLDTWFSSALWPFSTLGWPEESERLKAFYPTSVLVTGFDIIFFWVARMVMFGIYAMGEVPFKDVYMHGLVRDNEGQKMSKSKGNVLDPIDIIDGISLEDLVSKRTSNMMQPKLAAKIEKATRRQFPEGINAHGTDALRFTFCSLATMGRDVVFDMGRAEGYRNFCNKIWNAVRYVTQNVEGKDCGLTGEVTLSVADRWIISELQKAEQAVHEAIESYRFDFAAQTIYEFIWNEYCDWYLELTKAVLYGDSDELAMRGTRRTLVKVLEAALRLLHPIMPYVTEECWQTIAPLAGVSGESISTSAYPLPEVDKRDEAAEADIVWFKAVLLAIRRIRSEMNIAPSKPLPILLTEGSADDRSRVEAYQTMMIKLGKLESFDFATQDVPESAVALAGDLKINIPMKGLIDKDAELERLQREIDKRGKEQGILSGKLGNEKYVSNAPAELVARDQARLATLDDEITALQAQLTKIQAL